MSSSPHPNIDALGCAIRLAGEDLPIAFTRPASLEQIKFEKVRLVHFGSFYRCAGGGLGIMGRSGSDMRARALTIHGLAHNYVTERMAKKILAALASPTKTVHLEIGDQ